MQAPALLITSVLLYDLTFKLELQWLYYEIHELVQSSLNVQGTYRRKNTADIPKTILCEKKRTGTEEEIDRIS